jgi:hypothetical protein
MPYNKGFLNVWHFDEECNKAVLSSLSVGGRAVSIPKLVRQGQAGDRVGGRIG